MIDPAHVIASYPVFLLSVTQLDERGRTIVEEACEKIDFPAWEEAANDSVKRMTGKESQRRGDTRQLDWYNARILGDKLYRGVGLPERGGAGYYLGYTGAAILCRPLILPESYSALTNWYRGAWRKITRGGVSLRAA